jgi:hypothetical protein
MTETDIINQFDAAYWASQPPELRELNVVTQKPSGENVDDQLVRQDRAVQLAAKGFIIDTQIMIWGWDPYKVMKLRIQYGYTWVPSALQPPVQIAPGLTVPGSTLIPYDPLHPPLGTIKVSINPADFPPFDPPPPPTPHPANESPVGGMNLGNIYYAVPGEVYLDGAKFTDSRGTFVKHVVINPFGRTGYWELLSSTN